MAPDILLASHLLLKRSTCLFSWKIIKIVHFQRSQHISWGLPSWITLLDEVISLRWQVVLCVLKACNCGKKWRRLNLVYILNHLNCKLLTEVVIAKFQTVSPLKLLFYPGIFSKDIATALLLFVKCACVQQNVVHLSFVSSVLFCFSLLE